MADEAANAIRRKNHAIDLWSRDVPSTGNEAEIVKLSKL